MSKIVSGIELMQMIADRKIKDGTKIKIIGRFCGKSEYYFEYKGKFEIYDGNDKRYDEDKWTGCVSLYDLIHYSFEILEDKTEEIRLGVNDSNMEYVEFKNGGCTSSGYTKNYNKLDIMFFKRIKKLEEILNKQDTSKDENCMSD